MTNVGDKKPFLIDSHAHLELEPLVDDTEGVVRRAWDAGVIAIVTVGIDVEDAKKALDIADRFDNVYASVGFHPHNAKAVGRGSLAEMERLAHHPKVVAYGEIGLDFFRNRSPQSVQRSVFTDQLEIAKGMNKPVVIHLRDAYDEGMATLEKSGPYPAGGVIHCFSGEYEHAERALDLGFHISIPGTVTYKKNDRLRLVVRKLPADKVVLETDCPFLSPEPKRGKDNEPAYIAYTAAEVARIRNVSLKELARTASANAIRLYGLPLNLDSI
ncbi:MAG: TatD family hydrolase [Pseudomonadota bacterium]